MIPKNKINLGEFSLCINVKDIKVSLSFYQKLDFKLVGGDINEGWLILQKENLELGLFQEKFKENFLMNFRKGNIFKIEELTSRGIQMKSEAEIESDGSIGAMIQDPDGNLIYFNTHSDELE